MNLQPDDQTPIEVLATFPDSGSAEEAVDALRQAGFDVANVLDDTDQARAVVAWREMQDAAARSSTIATHGVVRTAVAGVVLGATIGALFGASIGVVVAAILGWTLAAHTGFAALAGLVAGSAAGLVGGATAGGVPEARGSTLRAHEHDAEQQLDVERGAVVGYRTLDTSEAGRARDVLREAGARRVDVDRWMHDEVEGSR